MAVKLTEATLRRIVLEEAGKFRRGGRGGWENGRAATEALSAAMEEYMDQMTMAGIDPEDACAMMQDEVRGWCEGYLNDVAGPEYL